ncbi:MAG TPA: hypothetical protein HA277_03300 [Methanosphaera sp.]|jgi:hypothetical protein|nr:hypothetical protein [Methanosphaera sp.]HIJ15408.1 hypothetical protein [Methanosphaera sp.]
MTKTKDLFEKRINEKTQIHEAIFKKEMKNLEQTIKNEKYTVETMISKTGLGEVYHDLIDSKDKLNSDYQSKFNKTYHSIDVELYKLNKQIENKSKMVNYKYNNKKEKVIDKVLRQIM